MGQTYDNEKEVGLDEVRALAPAVHAFMTDFGNVNTFLMTFRKDGTPIMRPVASFVEGWTIGTITQSLHVKTQHVRNNHRVGYLYVARGGKEGTAWAPKNVWVTGKAELVDDPAEVQRFFERRHATHGVGDMHPDDHGYTRLLIRTTPTYLRAEGFADAARPVVIRDFANL